MQYVEAPDAIDTDLPTLFLAGGITGCPDWQAEVVGMLKDEDVAVLNPRRTNFPIHDPLAAQQQIRWEFAALSAADVILFWFPASGPVTQPIALYELGRYVALGKTVVVGTDPHYIRRQDVEIQMDLASEGYVWHSLTGAVVSAEEQLDRVGRSRR